MDIDNFYTFDFSYHFVSYVYLRVFYLKICVKVMYDLRSFEKFYLTCI